MSMKSNLLLDDGISVIICCYNSEWIIARCLETLKKQKIPEGLPWEVVLVDNNCSDGTVAVAFDTMHGSRIDFQIVKESNPGLMNARKKGIATVKYRYCIYCDDDNLLSQDYVAYMHHVFATKQEIGAAGGKGIAEFEVEPEPSIMDYPDGYAVGSQTEHPDYLFGAGLALRTDVVRTIYDRFECRLVGRKGNVLLAGDDMELVYFVKLMGYSLYPTDDISYVHVLRKNRLTEEYRRRMYDGLRLALPIGDMMVLALNDNPIFPYFKNYLKSELILFINSLMFWKKKDVTHVKEFVAMIRFWGLPQLYSVYKECVSIKSDYCREMRLS